jgi:hypothetical protein
VTRVRTIAQEMQSAGDIAGGTSDKVHLMDTPAGRVSMQASGICNPSGRGVVSPTGCYDTRKFSCQSGTDAQVNTVANTGGRDVKVHCMPIVICTEFYLPYGTLHMTNIQVFHSMQFIVRPILQIAKCTLSYSTQATCR